MNRIHRAILKRASLGDKEALQLLTGLYYDTPAEDRAAFLMEALAESDKVQARLKRLELEQLEIKEAQVADVIEAAEAAQRDNLRAKGAGGDDEAS